MAQQKKQTRDTNDEIMNLLRRLLVLQLFELGVPQADIAKKLKMDILAVNTFLKGIKKNNAKKSAQ